MAGDERTRALLPLFEPGQDLALRRRIRSIPSRDCVAEQDYHVDFFRDNLAPPNDKDALARTGASSRWKTGDVSPSGQLARAFCYGLYEPCLAENVDFVAKPFSGIV